MSAALAPTLMAVAASNFMLLAAIAAGRLNKGWGQRLLLAFEITFLVLLVVGVVGIGLAFAAALGWQVARRDLREGLIGALALAVALSLGGMLTYLEYTLVGRRRIFRRDLRRSLWVGRSGVRRWSNSED